MNTLELKMVDTLEELKEKYGAFSVKAEFEAEGTKMEELLRLKEICMLSGMGLTLKIGGCESIRDMLEARTVGVNYLVAPMVESAYALQKYLLAVKKVFPEQERKDIEIICDIETKTACDELTKMIEIPQIDMLKGISIERVDLCYSMGLSDKDINNEKINQFVTDTFKTAKKKNIDCTLGGGISADTLPFVKSIAGKYLDKYETRKICFNCKESLKTSPEKGIFKALGFELLWLKNKCSFYRKIQLGDQQRMDLIEHHYLRQIDTVM